ncbi:MAG: hypothetical protein M3Y07_00270 [Acidobacteriota bacterium]|nr:hypothetical protein [Acidobacteriota bacterium]
MGPNDGGIKRGDSAETGNLEARPTATVDAGGSGVHGGGGGPEGHVTGQSSALGTGPTTTGSTRLDSLAGSSLSPDGLDRMVASLEDDPDLNQTYVEKPVDERVPSDED